MVEKARVCPVAHHPVASADFVHVGNGRPAVVVDGTQVSHRCVVRRLHGRENLY